MVSLGLVRTMNHNAAAVNTNVFAEYIMAGPISIRTAFKSLVTLAIMSPVRIL